MAIDREQVQLVSTTTLRKVPEIPTFANLAAFEDWWASVRIMNLPPRNETDGETVGVVQGTNNVIKRFRTNVVAHMWLQNMHVIRLYHGIDVRHGVGVINFPQ